MSAESETRARLLLHFQEMSGLGVEDSIQFLNLYNWNLAEITDAFRRDQTSLSQPLINSDPQVIQSTCTAMYPNLSEGNMRFDLPDDRQVENDREIARQISMEGGADRYTKRYQRTEEQQRKTPVPQPSVYHEKQVRLRCGLHSLNNLFQIPDLFTPAHLDQIVRQYDRRSFFNAFGSMYLGDYDINVLIDAIRQFGFVVQRINVFSGRSLSSYPWNSYFGLLMNFNGQHWITIKNVNGIYYNLDSTLRKPHSIGQERDLVNYLIHLMNSIQDVHIFAVQQLGQR